MFYFYETEGFIRWIELVRAAWILPYYSEYKTIINSGGHVKYLDLLKKIDDSFLVSLVSCPVCFSFWLSLIAAFSHDIKYYSFINFFGLGGYFLLKILQNKSNIYK